MSEKRMIKQMSTQFVKYENNPVMGSSELGTCFDVYVTRENGRYRMDFSWRPKRSLAVTFSDDGIHWEKYGTDPVFAADPKNIYEQNRVGGCQVIKTPDMGYVMFYIGYETIDKAQICVAHSPNGITDLEKSPFNPIITPTPDQWDADACYKPSILWNEEKQQWMLWYNGRKRYDEYIGYVYKDGRELF